MADLLGYAGIANAAINGINTLINYNNQRDVLNYQKGLQRLIFQREDNAIQRRVADLKKAGLNPLLAAGSAAGSGSVVPTVAPQIAPMDFMTPLSMAQNIRESESNVEYSTARLPFELAKMSSERNLLDAKLVTESMLQDKTELEQEKIVAEVAHLYAQAKNISEEAVWKEMRNSTWREHRIDIQNQPKFFKELFWFVEAIFDYFVPSKKESKPNVNLKDVVNKNRDKISNWQNRNSDIIKKRGRH